MAASRRRSLRHVLLFLMGISLVYENFALVIGGRSFSYAMLLLIPWALCLVDDFKRFGVIFRRFFYEISLLVLFLALIMVQNFLNSSLAMDTPVFPGTLFFNTVFFLLLLLDFTNHPEDLNTALFGFAIGSMFVPFLFFGGVGVEFDDSGRLVFFGNNSNVFGVRMCFAIGIIVQLFIIQDVFRLKANRFWFFIPLFLITAVFSATGSRTAFLCLLLVLGVTVVFYKGKGKFAVVLLGTIAFVVLFASLRGTVILDRLLESINTGDTGGRTDIWEALLPYCWENPWFGVGTTGYDWLATRAYGRYVNPHNVIIEVFAYSGLVGLSLYVLFWIRVLFHSFKLRKNHIYLPLILFLPLLVNIFCGHVIETKISYLIYAYSLYVYQFLYGQTVNYNGTNV